jgi:hypothetical protein
MKLLKIFRVVFLVLFLAAFVPAAVYVIQDIPKINKTKATLDQRTADRKQLQSEVREANIKRRGYSESLAALPDSLILAEATDFSKQQKKLNMDIFSLNQKAREASRLERKSQRTLDELKTHLKQRMFLFGGLALVFLGGFIICSRRLSIRA